jgi:hypothetical protein
MTEFLLRLRPTRGDALGLRGLRFLLKRALRDFGLRCIDAKELPRTSEFPQNAGKRPRRFNPAAQGERMGNFEPLGEAAARVIKQLERQREHGKTAPGRKHSGQVAHSRAAADSHGRASGPLGAALVGR